MLLTIAKVFLYDLANVGGIYRSLSFLGLAVSLILVSLLYQRFVFQTQSRRQAAAGVRPGGCGSTERDKEDAVRYFPILRDGGQDPALCSPLRCCCLRLNCWPR